MRATVLRWFSSWGSVNRSSSAGLAEKSSSALPPAISAQRLPVESSLCGDWDSLQGELRIACVPAVVDLLCQGGMIADFMQRYPEITLSFHDLAVEQLGQLGDYDLMISPDLVEWQGLAVRKLAPYKRYCYAAPAYLERYGALSHPRELKDHRCISYSPYSWGNGQWTLHSEGAQPQSFAINQVLKSEGYSTVWQLLLQGQGISVVSEVLAREAEQQGLVTRLFDGEFYCPASICVVHRQERANCMRLKVFIDAYRDHMHRLIYR
ncbi:LysR substrate-binding domain-containing protein [Aliagarivorans marinus]|uniref:LysR substrate-binding domain-containing protein n=1 Tax=Aliagarivorans marinus TaxID=561965 RepID=UPI000A078436|nr:LysR substrate-binding domain-containing protein [Aliagarivorans marinus]